MKKVSIFYISGVTALAGMVFIPLAAFAQTSSTSNPYIQTYKTADGVTVYMNLPNDFKGEVSTVYDNGQWQTYSTTTPLSATDIANIQDRIQAEEASMQQLFAQEQQMYQEQEQMFQNMFGSGF